MQALLELVFLSFPDSTLLDGGRKKAQEAFYILSPETKRPIVLDCR